MSKFVFNDIEWIICDIEGTTSSISFVKDVLFPEARRCLVEFLIENQKEDSIKTILKAFWNNSKADEETYFAETSQQFNIPDPSNVEKLDSEFLKPFVVYYDWMMSKDRKELSLKQLQGMIWKQGYVNGSIKGHVYPEVPGCLEKWSKVCKIAIYSSGSVQAQKLLFSFTEYGDLNVYIQKNYDIPSAGPKIESNSYNNILKDLQIEPSKVLFLTDSLAEINAAKLAQINTVLLKREQTQSDGETFITNFLELSINNV